MVVVSFPYLFKGGVAHLKVEVAIHIYPIYNYGGDAHSHSLHVRLHRQDTSADFPGLLHVSFVQSRPEGVLG